MEVTEKDLDFIPAEQRERFLRYFEEGTVAAIHSTENKGSWRLPEPDKDIIAAMSKRLLPGKEEK